MFPNGYVPGMDLSVDDLVNEGYAEVTVDFHKIARNMVIDTTSITWTASGDTRRQTIYSVWEQFPKTESCLSCYGAKMLQDWRQREQYHNLQEVQVIKDAGFNYTGLQE